MASRVHFLLLVLAFPAFCSCASVGDKFENNEEKSSQGTKRESINPFERGNLLGDKFQPWDDWINKRGFSLSGADDRFSPLDRNAYQGWSDWLAKRTGSPLAGDVLGDQWNNWESGRYAPGFGSGNQFQRWDDFVKRQHPFMPASLNSLSRANYQSWQDWMKRGDLGGPLGGYGGLSNNDLLMSWEDLSKLNKRYQWFGMQPYGSFRRPFSYGLQDWRASPYGLKRSTDEAEKAEN